MPSPLRRFAPPAVKLAILVVVIWGGHRTISAALDDLRRRNWQLDQLQVGWAVLSGVLYLVSQLPCGWFWHSVLGSLGQKVRLLRALRAYFIGHLGKYVPGKAMVVVMRAGLIGAPHVRTSLAVVAVFYETFTTMACGAALAFTVLIATHRDRPWLILGSLALAAIVGLPTVPVIFVRLLRLMRIVPAEPSLATAAEQISPLEPIGRRIHLRPAILARGWLTIGVGWLFAGASLWAAIRAVGVNDVKVIADLPLYTATVALAVVLGFISMLPAGVGVRDVALMQLLAPHIETLVPNQGQLLAFVAVIVLRLIWLMAEALLATIMYPLRSTLGTDPR